MSVATLKKFQKDVLDELNAYFKQVTLEGGRSPSRDAAEALGVRDYKPRQDACGRDVPTVCIKVPTGGGKTLLALEAIGAAYASLLRERHGTGLVVWIVPSGQIYRDTLRRLRTEGDLYHDMLKNMTGAIGIDVWEKHEIARMTPTQLGHRLNVLMLMIQSGAAVKSEARKLYRDSGGNIVNHFPAEDDLDAHRAWKAATPNLETIEDTDLLKTSVGNLIRKCRPLMILDEQHKFTTTLARDTIAGFNPSAVVEFSATPKDANVLVTVTGAELLKEHMIKLPINIMSSNLTLWEDCLDKARLKRNELAALAKEAHETEGRYLRPIVLVQVERTGADQRGKGAVHSEDVREYLIERAGVPERAIKVKSSAKDEIENIDLLDEGCPVEFIITKQALQEGWDCPFAYVLVSLNEAGSQLAMTQLIGRVLRQPDQLPFVEPALNESYVYCLHRSAADLGKEVKSALEKEGYQGGGMTKTSGSAEPAERQTFLIKERFRSLYKEFNGSIYLPYFCVRSGKRVERLSYYEHLMMRVDPARFDLASLRIDLANDAEAMKETRYRATLGENGLTREDEIEAQSTETVAQIASWLVANLNYPFFSFRQVRALVSSALSELRSANGGFDELLPLAKYTVRDRIREAADKEIQRQARELFDTLLDSGELMFFLEKKECRYPIPASVKVNVTNALQHPNGQPVAKNLFEYTDQHGLNEYEKSVALYLDSHPEILWWYRNKVGPSNFSIQGWQEPRIYPDFIAATGDAAYPDFVYVVESKGRHLADNEDTKYKEGVAEAFESLGKKVSWRDLGKEFSDRVFRFQVIDQGKFEFVWKDALGTMLETAA